jgi:hypothetical protein
MARKQAIAAKNLAELASREEERNLAEHERVRELANAAMGGSFTAILKKSPSLNEDDRAFLKELRYI